MTNDVRKENIQNIIPLAPLQLGMLYHWLAAPEESAYFQQLSYRARGALRVELVERCWQRLVDRHEILRTVYKYTNTPQPLQLILTRRDFVVEYYDYSGIVPERQAGKLQALRQSDQQRGFDLRRDMLMRMSVVKLADDEWELIWSHHHILMDGWSMGILQREFLTLYQNEAHEEGGEEGRALGRAPQYSELVRYLRRIDRQKSENLWKRYLAGHTPGFPLPGASQSTSTSKRELFFTVADELTQGVSALARACSTTTSRVLETLWGVLLARYQSTDDVVFGAVVSGRPADLPGAEDMVGLFANTIALRIQIDSTSTLRELLEKHHGAMLELADHQQMSLADAQRMAGIRGDQLHSHYSFENFPVEQALDRDLDRDLGLQVTDVRIHDQTHYDLDIQFVPYGRGLKARLAFQPDRVDRELAESVPRHFARLLARALEAPDAPLQGFGLVDPSEAAEIHAQLNPDHRDIASTGTLVSRFEAHARKAPQRIALRCEGDSVTYGQLDGRANALARDLVQRGVAPGQLVGLCLPRSSELLVGMLGILKAGAAYVPLDPKSPMARLQDIARDAELQMMVTSEVELPGVAAIAVESGADLERDKSTGNAAIAPRGCSPDRDSLAYVMYTSGTTGRPKGVRVSHGNVVRLFDATAPRFEFDPSDVWSLFHSVAFDFSVWEIWGALLHGATLVVVPYWVSRAPAEFWQLLHRDRVTMLSQTPSAFRHLIAEDAAHDQKLALRCIVFGGEALSTAMLAPWLERHGDRTPRLINMYGITETTVHVTYRRMRQGDVGLQMSPIGCAIPDLELFLLDAGKNPVPRGVVGEIYVAGAGVSQGYWRRDQLTAERFVSAPALSGKSAARGLLYRSGDLARLSPAGELEYLGRADRQVKIRGFRIELGEIEAAVDQHEAVQRTVLRADDVAGQAELVAFVATVGEITVSELREHCAGKVPDYMVPARFVRVSHIPLTKNGKVDYGALDGVAIAEPKPRSSRRPGTEIEQILTEVWAEALAIGNADQVGIADSYFALGGDSIKAITVVSKLRSRGYQVAIRDLFRFPTIAELAPRVEAVTTRHVAEARPGAVAMSPAQKRFFAIHRRAPEHFNHALLIERASGFDRARLREALTRLIAAHDVFRLRFPVRGGTRAAVLDHRAPPVEVADHDLRGAAQPWEELSRRGDELHRSLDLGNGPLWRASLFTLDQGQILGLIMHHLLTDGVSWRILLTQLGAIYSALESGVEPPELATSAPFTVWTQAMQQRVESPAIAAEVDYWARASAGATGTIASAAAGSPSRYVASESQAKSVEVKAALSRDRLARANRAYGTNTEELLLTALFGALHQMHGQSEWVICLEGHGRDGVPCDLPIEQTVGWFTAIYPFRLQANPERDLGYRIKHVKESLRNVPHRGQGYGLLRYGLGAAGAAPSPEPEISFNFLGELDSGLGEHDLRLVPRSLGEDVSPQSEREFSLQLAGSVLGGVLQLGVTYSETVIDAAAVDALCRAWRAHLDRVIEHCVAREAPELTPSDLTYSDLSLDELEEILS